MRLKNHRAIRNTFKAYERLKREQHIDTLFRTGKAYSVFPIRLLCLPAQRGEEFSPVRVGFSVPKKKFKLSVDRHRIRRLMVEAWRLQKQAVYTTLPDDVQLHLFLVYTDKEMPTQELVMVTVQKAIDYLIKKYGKSE